MITPAEIDAGQTAYDQVAAFAALRRKRIGHIYVLFPILLVIMGVVAWRYGVESLALASIGSALLSAFFAAWNWRRLHAEDARNRALLAKLHVQYGENLPWLEAERQMAEIRRIQAEEALGGNPPEGA